MGKYLLLERLATGGMAEVYRAKSQGAGGFEKQLAIKRILPNYSQNEEFRKMFEYEARLSSGLTHSNIVQIFDFDKFGETYLLAMEYVDGKNLRQFVNKCRKVGQQFSIEFSVFVINEVCKGLDYAHAKKHDLTGKPLNIIHRDMSPQNIMLAYEGAVKIVDFGIAKAKDRVDETRSGVIKGKFGYMSPEQANGLPVDHRTDIFSTGIILWELLTGRRLFAAEGDLATLRLIQECVVAPPSRINPRVPPELDRIVMKVLSKDTKLRYTTAGDLHRHLLEFLSKTAPAFTQREVAQVIQTVCQDDIVREKRRFEQIYRQSIPYSQGVAKSEQGKERALDDIADALDGLQTRSEVIEDTGETFSDEHSLLDDEPANVEEPSVGARSEPVLEGPAPSKLPVEPKKMQSPVESTTEPEEPLTKSEHSASLGEDEIEIRAVVEDPSRSNWSEVAIDLKDNSASVDWVLPGGTSHQEDAATKVGKPEVDGNPKKDPAKKAAGRALPEDGEAKSTNWSGANIVAMSASGNSDPETGSKIIEPSVDTAPADSGESTVLSQTVLRKAAQKKTPVKTESSGESRRTPGVATLRNSSSVLELENDAQAASTAPKPRASASRARVARKRPLLPPMVRLAMVITLTGYLGQKYFDGTISQWMETVGTRQLTFEEGDQESSPTSAATGNDRAVVTQRAVGSCAVTVESDPMGAQVYADGRALGPTPVLVPGPCNGGVMVELRKEGYEDYRHKIVLSSRAQEWRPTLKPITLGWLVLELGFDCRVYVDGSGESFEVTKNTPKDIPLRSDKEHVVRFENSALGIDFKQTIRVEQGKRTAFRRTLETAIAP